MTANGGNDDDRADAVARDREDPLNGFRDRFDLPDRCYMDGNSLGPCSDAAIESLHSAIEEWRHLGIRGWTDGDPPWFEYGERLGDRIAPFLGADPAECVVANGTTVNIHTLIGTFLEAVDGDSVLVNELDFPTDHYAIRAQLQRRGFNPEHGLLTVESRDGRTIDREAIETAIVDHEPAIVFFPSVLYRSGQRFDLESLTELAHDHGALAGFDLAHSVGLVPHDLGGADVDFAVWCSYKYLNAGPGAIAGLYVNERHFEHRPSLPGWWGNRDDTQFDMHPEYDPAPDASAYQISTVPVFSAAPLFGSTEILADAGIDAVFEKSRSLTEYCISLVETHLTQHGYAVGTPRDPDHRGGHVAIEHDHAEAISHALRDEGTVVDYRPPNVIRVCPAPLYTRFQDVYDTVQTLRETVVTGGYRQFRDYDHDVT